MTEPSPSLVLAVKPNPRVEYAAVYEDNDLLVIGKPAGLVTQPGKGHATDALLNGLFAKYGRLLHNLGARRDFGLLHRLDKDTSGLLVVAKLPSAYDQLRRDFEERKVEKEYLTLVAGVPKPAQGVIQARLKEVTVGIKKSIVSKQGQEAVSAYWTLAATEKAALVRVRIKTGRLHQIRVHMLYLGTPVLGDEIYLPVGKGPALPHAPRLCLHAAQLGFKHPMTGKWLKVVSPLPAELAAYAKRLGLGAGLGEGQEKKGPD